MVKGWTNCKFSDSDSSFFSRRDSLAVAHQAGRTVSVTRNGKIAELV